MLKSLYIAILSLFFFAFSISQVQAEENIKIASIYAFSGVAAGTNKASIRGVRHGIQEINRRGGVLGREIKVIEFDNQSTPIGSKVAADMAIQKDVLAIIGAAYSSHTLAIAKVAQANHIPMITNVSTNTKITRIGDYIFRVCYTDSFQGEVMAAFGKEELKVSTAVIFTDISNDYSMELSDKFQHNFKKRGGKILAQLKYKQNQRSYRHLLLQAKKMNPAALFIPGYDESALIIKDAIDAGIRAIFLGGDGWGDQTFFDKGGAALKRGFHCTHWAEEVGNKISREYIRKYKKNEPIHASEILAYDAVLLLVDAIRRAGSTDRQKIRHALAKTKNFKGATGTITFNDAGDPIKNAVIMEIAGGRYYFLKSYRP
ncbi:MAG: ABC transporter substrate-binding protein [Desulfobacterales bacterium]|nr:ABC transporter substrate-binding protein [Deltaproteobacteria bacterium]NNL43585.1 ABC transporter substrate-binding protein [Desulfobacterales bacterium]